MLPAVPCRFTQGWAAPPGAGRKAAAVSCLVLAIVPLPAAVEFTRTLPGGMPAMDGWEKVTGEAELESPRLRVQYEFYVNPRRPGLYELIRYRVTLPPGERADEYPPTEKLQWQAGEKDMRRFECGAGDVPGSPCRWRELKQGSPEYHREMPVIVWLYGLHRRLLEERDSPR